MKDTLRHKAITGLAWSGISQVSRQGFSLVVSFVLARLLGPTAYGLIGMVVVFTGFGSMFIDLGLGAGLIQRKDLKEEHINGVFWVNMLMGGAMTLLTVLVAPLIADFYNQPALTAIVTGSSLGFMLGALGTVQNSLLTRKLRFGALAMIDIISTALSGLLGIFMALKGFGVWSLVGQSLSLSFIRTMGLWFISPWRPKARFHFTAIKDFAGFSGNLSGFNLLNYWVRNADNLLIGKYLGGFSLGIYSRAYQLMVLPVYQISGVASNVMFPVLSSIQHDKERVRKIYLRAISSIHLIAAPIYSGLFVAADTFVPTVLGERWLGLVPVLRILCIVGFFQPVGNSTGWLYTSLGRTAILFRWGVLSGVMYIVGFFLGLKWGLLGVTWSYCIVGLLSWYPSWSIPGRLAGLSFLDMLTPLLPASACAVIMGAGTWLIGLGLKPMMPVAAVLALQVISGAVIYGCLVVLLRLKSGQELWAVALERLRPRQAKAIG